MVIIDTEIYSNYFLFSALDTDTGKIRHCELYEGHTLNTRMVSAIMQNYTTLGFNSNNFDLPIVVAALRGWDNLKIKALSDNIILNRLPLWRVAKDYGIEKPEYWNHIDIIEVVIGKASLKIYGARIHEKKIQDLPIEPDAILTRKQMIEIRDYCENDLHTTAALYEKLKPQIKLRESMSEQYGIDLRSKSDAQIAEAVIVSELRKLTGLDYYKQEVKDGQKYKYQDPKIISYQSNHLNDLFNQILETDFEVGANGSIVLPDWMRNYDLRINGTPYTLGIGGLHSCEKSQYLEADDNHLLIDLDVASYYPNIILQQKIAPKSMGNDFLNVYQKIVNERLAAKKLQSKIKQRIATLEKELANVVAKKEIASLKEELVKVIAETDSKKLAINGSFGKLGSKYSTLYAPQLLIQTTITGQLALLMLIESFELAGIKVVSANTDGVVMYCPKDKEQTLSEIAFDWMLDTSFELERTDYKVLASRDVNNYLAVKTNGSIKGKGLYAEESLSKNPDFLICCQAVAQFIAKRTPIEHTIRECKDVRKFVSVRKVTGGAVWGDEFLGKAVRFYKSSAIPETTTINYKKNSNKVPNSGGCRPLMELPDTFPADINYDFYINRAKEYLLETGWKL